MPVECVCQVCGRPFLAWPHEAARGRPTCGTACRDARKRVPLAERFWRHVERTPTCWWWTGATNPSGAGVLAVREGSRARTVQALRVAWELHHGPIPPGWRVWHRCRRSACVRPDHLYLVRARHGAATGAEQDGWTGGLPRRPTGRFASGLVGQRRTWWTREQVVDALRRFHDATGQAPTGGDAWYRLTATPNGSPRQRRTPSAYAVLRVFPSFRAAWAAVGVQVPDRHGVPWSAADDARLRAGFGRVPTATLARDLGRGVSGMRKRARALGCVMAEAWGWPLKRAARAAGVSRARLQAYADAGILPAVRGAAHVYLDPADLVVIPEIDWTRVTPELEAAALWSLRARLVRLLAGRDARAPRIRQLSPVPSTDLPSVAEPAATEAIVPGAVVRVVGLVPTLPQCRGRVGRVARLYRSATGGGAVVVFPGRGRGRTGGTVAYRLPLGALALASGEPGRGHGLDERSAA